MKENLSSSHFTSFRDPTGNLFLVDSRVIRLVTPEGQDDLQAFLKSGVSRKFFDSGRVVRSWQIDKEHQHLLPKPIMEALSCKGKEDVILLEHEKIPFSSYPYEWAPEMLHAAASLTLELAQELQSQGLGMKDATPYNILFNGPKPVFVDILSFEKRDPRDPTWLPYAQFIRTFILPLQASRHLGIGIDQLLMTKRDGVEPEELYRWLRPFKRMIPPCLTLVTLPTWLGSAHKPSDTSIYRKKLLKDPEKAAFVLRSIFSGLNRALARSKPLSRKSTWSDYMEGGNTYTSDTFQAKEAFVERALDEHAPKTVLDIGCNTGHFSMLAARHGSRVVAIDYDAVVIGQVWQKAMETGLNILPLVVNITRPSPALGWNNQEHSSFLQRAQGSFDMILMLAVLHHMLVTERVPLPEILRVISGITADLVVLEYVDRMDPMFQTLTRGRDHLHTDFTPEYFESACRVRFEILRCQEIGTRRLYLMRKK